MIVSLPGVYRPQDDTSLLVEALKRQVMTDSTRVLDLCAGTGALSVAAAKAGAGRVLAIDISRRAIVNVGLNRLLNNVGVEARRGDLTEALNGEVFDLVVSNPPYVPSEIDELPATGIERAWNAGTSGRVLLDRIIASAPDVLAPGGSLLLLQSVLCDVGKTEAMLEERGMSAEVVAWRSIPFGPVLRSRRAMLERRGLIEHGQEIEELVVLRACKPLPTAHEKRSGRMVSHTSAAERSPRNGEDALSEPQSSAHAKTKLGSSVVDDSDTFDQLRGLLDAMGFRITDTVETRTDTEIVVVLTLAPEGCVRIQTGAGVADISLDIEHVGTEVAEYLRNHVPTNILRKVKISVKPISSEHTTIDPLTGSKSMPHETSARYPLQRTGDE
jgi:HemK-related putative methylase